jgi:hypothetical protein
MEFYSAIKKNEAMWFKVNGYNWRTSGLSEVSQAQKDKGSMFSLICGRYNTNTKNVMKNRSH